MLTQNGVAADRASQIADLACHAAERAMETITNLTSNGADFGIKMMSFELALQLAIAGMQDLFEKTHKIGASLGAPQMGAMVTLKS